MKILRITPCLLLTLLLAVAVVMESAGLPAYKRSGHELHQGVAIAPIARAYVAAPEAAQEVPYGPWLNAVEFYMEWGEAAMLEKLDKGERHIWLCPIDTVEGIKKAEELPNVEFIKAYLNRLDFLLNPLPRIRIEGEKRFNPFGIREVREALNLYLDREYVAKEIFAGYAIPQYTVWSPIEPDYKRVQDYMKSLEAEYAYNREKAWEMVYNALTRAGCTYRGGKWYDPENKTIVIKFWIRKSPPQKNALGHYFADELEKLGFTVIRRECTGREAMSVVYSGIDDWNIYTEGWPFTAISAYDDGLPYYMYCSPWTGKVFEYYQPSDELVSLAGALMMANYTSADERNEWVKYLARLCIKDSTRIWCVQQITPFPYNRTLINIAYDLAGGFFSPFALRTARFYGSVGGTCKAGDYCLFVSAFNPVGGFEWLYDKPVYSTLYDYGVLPHPHTGRYIPIRAIFHVETAGPDGVLAVPADALMFNASALDWYEVGPGLTATSAVTFNFIFGMWHHNETMTMADVVAGIAHWYRLACEDDPIYDPYVRYPAFLNYVVAFKIENETALTVYLNYWHFDEAMIAAAADVWPHSPWELLALMDSAVEARELAYSYGTAGEWRVEWLDLTKGDSLDILAYHLTSLKAGNHIPPYMQDPDLPDFAQVTDTNALARWDALSNWYSIHEHFLVSCGPYYLDVVDTVTPMLRVKAFRDGYPLKADYLDTLLGPSTMANYVPRASLSISCSCPSTYIGFKVSIYGNLTYQNGTGIPNAYILLSYSVTRGETWSDITVATTDENGTFYAEWIPPATGDFLMRAVWIRDSVQMPISAIISLSVLPYQERYIFSVESNSTITGLAFNPTSRVLSFLASGPANTTGYCEVTISKALVSNASGIEVYLDGNRLNYTVSDVGGSWVLYFVYKHSTHRVEIKLEAVPTPSRPEWPKWTHITAVATISAGISALVVVLIYKRKVK